MTVDTPHMTLAETALYMTLSRRKVGALVTSGELPSSKIGRRRIVDRKDVDAYIARHRGSSQEVTA